MSTENLQALAGASEVVEFVRVPYHVIKLIADVLRDSQTTVQAVRRDLKCSRVVHQCSEVLNRSIKDVTTALRQIQKEQQDAASTDA